MTNLCKVISGNKDMDAFQFEIFRDQDMLNRWIIFEDVQMKSIEFSFHRYTIKCKKEGWKITIPDVLGCCMIEGFKTYSFATDIYTLLWVELRSPWCEIAIF